MSNTVNTLLNRVVDYQYNPVAIQKTVIDMLEEITNGTITVVDPTNPFVFCLESAAVMTAAFMAKNEANTRRQYPMAAQTAEDLYLHMSDKDYADRFATPASAKVSFLFSKTEAINKMVEDPVTGIRKLVLPRNTYVTVADTVFSLHYPIEICQLQHGGLQVVYDADKTTPLHTLSTNAIDWEIRTGPDGEYIFFEVEMYQFGIISQTAAVSLATDFKLDILFDNQFYYARVFIESSLGEWIEVKTTHSEQVYDPNVVTATLKVVDNRLTVRIPQIYVNAGAVKSNVRVDLYHTKGKLDMMLQNYPVAAYQASWKAYDKADETVYSAPLKTFRQLLVYSDKVVTGGSNVLGFAQLRERVINNAVGEQQLPITNVQLSAALANEGYEVVKNIDVVTNRVFLATRSMPEPIDPKLITAAASSIETVMLSIDTATNVNGVVDNGETVTLTPSVLYKLRNGKAQLVQTDEVERLLSMPPDQRALAVTSGNYLYTPFHYVLDLAGDEFAVRPYYLDNPEMITKLFVSQNDTTLMQATTQSYDVVRTATGYAVRIITASSDNFRQLADDEVFVQMAYTPKGERDRAYLMGVLVDKTEEGERIYEFDLSTNFSLDADDALELSEFFLYTQEPRYTKTPLIGMFDILYATASINSDVWVPDRVDGVLGRFLLPSQVYGISHEQLRIKFGDALKTLWARSRSVVSSAEYQKWEVDVPRRYEADIYQTDPDTGAAFTIDEQGQLQYTVLHRKGDPVLDGDGQVSYQYRVGDVILAEDGLPIVTNPRGMLRQVDIMMIEGAYWFATDIAAINYRLELTRSIVGWLAADLVTINDQLLEQTRLYFYPKTKLGNLSVMIRDGQTTTIDASQSLKVVLYVGSSVFGNDDLRTQLSLTTIRTISEMLKSATVSVSAIVSELRASYGSDVIDVQFSGLGGYLNLPALTVLDDSKRCSIRKRLVSQADETLMVQEDVLIDFVRHEMMS